VVLQKPTTGSAKIFSKTHSSLRAESFAPSSDRNTVKPDA